MTTPESRMISIVILAAVKLAMIILKGFLMATLFYEPSTRTRLSLESAMKRLGREVLTTENAREFSSAAKGETLEDSIRTVEGYSDIIVMRHFESGAAQRAVATASIPVINAGDGPGQHPTQVRAKLSTFGFGGPTEVTCGGNALKFYASVRLNIRRTGLVKKGEETVGSQVLVKIVKNKHAPPFRTAQFELEFGKGICQETELIELGSKHKFITKGGAFYSMNGQSFRGKDAIKQYLAANPSVKGELMMKLREKLLDSEEDKGKESEAEAVDTDPTGAVVSSDTTDEEEISAVEA